jgi:uncharacterized membrane protein YhaH (DUF805 family)
MGQAVKSGDIIMRGSHLILGLLVFVLVLIPVIKIIRKAGYSGWWVLLWFIPIGNIVALWIFAFADWPALRERSQARP